MDEEEAKKVAKKGPGHNINLEKFLKASFLRIRFTVLPF